LSWGLSLWLYPQIADPGFGPKLTAHGSSNPSTRLIMHTTRTGYSRLLTLTASIFTCLSLHAQNTTDDYGNTPATAAAVT
jgi:hypothetical protein